MREIIITADPTPKTIHTVRIAFDEGGHHKIVSHEVATHYNPNIERILEDVCELLNIRRVDMRGHSRKREVVFARFAFFYIAKVIYDYSLVSIGECVNRHHGTVMYGKEEFRNLKKQNHPLVISYLSKLKDVYNII